MPIAHTLTEICKLQPSYASANTPAMQERGRLVRQVLRSEVEALGPQLRAALGPFGDDLMVDASDGIGRKTEAPWVRVSSERMSPNARTGFYVVIHFAADGSATYITVGCGATVWANGDLTPLSWPELDAKTGWARAVVMDRFGGGAPFIDQIHLGAKALLPQAFERATALARRLAVGHFDDSLVEGLLVQATTRLAAIYEAQRLGADLTTAQAGMIEIDSAINPSRPSRSGQGFRLSHVERVAIELRAMTLAQEWLEAEGFTVKDTSKDSSYDFEATRDGVTLKVEVKGSTATSIDSFFMTRNEVELHRAEKGRTALLIVAGIAVSREHGEVAATGGTLTPRLGWDIDTWDAVPYAYQIKPKAQTAVTKASTRH